MIWLWMYEPHGGVFNEILKSLRIAAGQLAASEIHRTSLYHCNECVERDWL